MDVSLGRRFRLVAFQSYSDEGEAGAYRLNLQDGSTDLLFTPVGRGLNASLGWVNGDRAVYYRREALPGRDRAYRIHDLLSGQEREILPEGSGAAISLSPDESRFAVLRANPRNEKLFTISLMDVASGQMTQLAELPRGARLPMRTTTWTPDGNNILFWRHTPPDRNDTPLDLWTLPADGGQPRKTELSLTDIVGPSPLIRIHPDGERVTFSAGIRKLEVWKLSNFPDRVTAND